MAIMALLVQPLALSTVHDGILFDNDDAMRLVQLREWMDGKGWYDVTQDRINPPASPISHWSRIVEVPIAAAILVAQVFAPPAMAERIAVALWPVVLLSLYSALLLYHARRFFSTPALLLGAMVVGFNPLLLFQLLPGRIDHHGVQMVLALLLLILTGEATVRLKQVAAIAAGVVASLMLAIGLETLPLVATAAATFGAAWIVRGTDARRTTACFGAALALGAPMLFGLSISPSRWTTPACDALSLPWLWLAVAGGGALALLATIPQPGRLPVRAAFAFGAAAFACATFLATWPNCLDGPYATVDPLVRELWLSGVGETRPLLRLAVENPTGFLFFAVSVVGGWAALVLAAVRMGRRAPEILILLAFGSTATAVAMSEMRGAPFAATFGVFGWLYLLDRAFAGFSAASSLATRPAAIGMRGAIVVVTLLAASPVGWNVIAAQLHPAPAAPPDHGGCRTPADMAALAAEPPGLVLAPIRLGSRLLMATPHSVLGAPYHRNNAGNRTDLEILIADPANAERLIRDRGIEYVALCLDDPDLPVLTRQGDGNLIKVLAEGKAPGWLQPIAGGGPIRAWRVVAP